MFSVYERSAEWFKNNFELINFQLSAYEWWEIMGGEEGHYGDLFANDENYPAFAQAYDDYFSMMEKSIIENGKDDPTVSEGYKVSHDGENFAVASRIFVKIFPTLQEAVDGMRLG